MGNGPVFDAARNDQELAFLEPDLPVAEIHPESSLHHQEHLVLVLMVVPDEFSLELDEFDKLAVELADDLRAPMIVKLR